MRDSFVDAVTSAFGIRNMHDTEDALREIYRVIRPEGRVVILEFSLPESFITKTLSFYLKKIIPVNGFNAFSEISLRISGKIY